MKEWIVVYVDGVVIKEKKVKSKNIAEAAEQVVIVELNVLMSDIVMVVENSGNGAFCVDTAKKNMDLDFGIIYLDAVGALSREENNEG